jgi:threonine/homoserine/homoserine lactone efflux protein
MDWALADAVAVGASLLALVAWAVTRGRRRGLLWAATLPLLVPVWHVLVV